MVIDRTPANYAALAEERGTLIAKNYKAESDRDVAVARAAGLEAALRAILKVRTLPRAQSIAEKALVESK